MFMDADMIDMLWYIALLVALVVAVGGFWMVVTATDDD